MSHSRPSDRQAAFTGLIVGTIFVIVVIVVINMLTNKKFAGHEAAKPTASAMR
jgi:uncharacterized protein (DUF983 family)